MICIDQALLIRRNTFFVLHLSLDIGDGVRQYASIGCNIVGGRLVVIMARERTFSIFSSGTLTRETIAWYCLWLQL